LPHDQLSLRKRHQITTPDAFFSAGLEEGATGIFFRTPEGDQSFELHQLQSLTQLPGQTFDVPRRDPGWLGRGYTNWFGARLTFIVTGKPDTYVFGSNPYTLNSILAAAAMHAGLVKEDESKTVRVEIMLAPAKFVGSERHGIASCDWEEPENGAFRFLDAPS
jgi:hypothetical protein